jgi:hypothetical protein
MKPIATIALLAALGGSLHAEARAESLIVPPYPAATPWKALPVKQNEKQKTEQWIPADQSETDIRDLFEVDTDTKPMNKDALSAMTTEVFFARIHCRRANVGGPHLVTENGYEVAYAQVYCAGNKDSNQDIDSFFKVIVGKSANYTILRQFLRPAARNAEPGKVEFPRDKPEQAKAHQAALEAAEKFLLEQVQVCPLADGSACPPPGTKPVAPPQTSEPEMEPPGPNDVSAKYDLTPGKTTIADVENKMGKPTITKKEPDGRMSYVFRQEDNTAVICFFSRSGILIRTRFVAPGQ